MTVQTAASAAYIVAALLFILALAGLSRHETARFGNTFGIAGMAIALVATLVLAISGGFTGLQVGLLIGAVLIGAAIGLYRAARVPMTGMPELIALFHSFVGLAAVLVGWNGYLEVEAGRRRRRRARPRAAGHPPRRGRHRRVHRRGHLHRLDRRLGQAVGAVQLRARWCCPARTS